MAVADGEAVRQHADRPRDRPGPGRRASPSPAATSPAATGPPQSAATRRPRPCRSEPSNRGWPVDTPAEPSAGSGGARPRRAQAHHAATGHDAAVGLPPAAHRPAELHHRLVPRQDRSPRPAPPHLPARRPGPGPRPGAAAGPTSGRGPAPTLVSTTPTSPLEGERQHRPGGVRPDARAARAARPRSSGRSPAVAFDDGPAHRCRLTRPAVVAQPGPQPDHLGRAAPPRTSPGRGSGRGTRGTSGHPVDARLLDHHLRDEHRPGIAGGPPRQRPQVRRSPGQQRRGHVTHDGRMSPPPAAVHARRVREREPGRPARSGWVWARWRIRSSTRSLSAGGSEPTTLTDSARSTSRSGSHGCSQAWVHSSTGVNPPASATSGGVVDVVVAVVRSLGVGPVDEQVAELPHPVVVAVPRVPDQEQVAAGRAAPGAISPRATAGSNQWNAWATVTASNDPSAEGQRLGRAVVDLDVGQRGDEPVAHSGDRLDGHDLGAGRHEQAGQLARAGGEVEHPAARADAAVADDVGDGLGGIRRPRRLVGVGVAIEPQRLVLDPLTHVRSIQV